jgi:hypothetical protein
MSRFNIILEAAPDPIGRAPHARLQAALKLLLRGYALRAIEVREVEPDQPQDVRPPSMRRALKEQHHEP